MKYTLEIIGFNIESCITAEKAGANRIELCSSPSEGGTTPSIGLIRSARKNIRIPIYVMIRPRGGDFVYSDEEFEIMCDDVMACKVAGIDGIVIGILKIDGSVDIERCSRLQKLTSPMGVTFHRAFDRVKDPLSSLEQIIDIGFERILTSGLAPKTAEGLDLITQLVKAAEERIIIMPGSGISPDNIQMIAQKSGAKEFHSSASILKDSSMQFINNKMNENLQHIITECDAISEMVTALKKLS